MKSFKYSCPHPLFRYSSKCSWNGAPKKLVNPVVFVFERSRWVEPTPEQVAVYRLSKQIVEQLGGSMDQSERESAGKADVLSHKDVKSILAAVRLGNPTAKVIEHWNGPGCYSMSVGVDMGRRKA